MRNKSDCNFLIFEEYFESILWAFLLSEALGSSKDKIVETHRYLREEDSVKDIVRFYNRFYGVVL